MGSSSSRTLGLENKGACDGHTLALAAAELVGVAVAVLAAKPDLGEGSHDAAVGVAEAVDGDGSAECLVDRLVGMERSVGVLEDHLDDLAGFAGTAVGQFAAVDHHGSLGVRDQAGDGAKHGGFAGAGFADQAQRVAG